MLPPRYKGDLPIQVNQKQAGQILKLRMKRAKRQLLMMDMGFDVDHKKTGGHFTMARKKDRVRQSQANARPRINGLFVNKQKEAQLVSGENNQFAQVSNLSDEDETVALTNE